MFSIFVILLVFHTASACFCPPVISPSCGCGGGASYSSGYRTAPQQYYGGYGGGYPQQQQPQYSAGYPGSYAVIYRDLTPFRPSYYNAVPVQQNYYPPQPRPYHQPQAYTQPRPIPQQQVTEVTSQIIETQPAQPVISSQIPQETVGTKETRIYPQPAAPVAPLVETRTSATPGLHDAGYGEQHVTTAAPQVEEPDFVDEVLDTTEDKKTETEEKEETYYIYYDDQGNKVGDSRTGTTFAPDEIIQTVTETIVTEKIEAKESQSYDDVVEEATTKASVQLTTSSNGEVVYEDETIEYEDVGSQTTAKITTNDIKPSLTDKRGLADNQIMVDAAYNTGETNGSYNKKVVSAKGVKIVTKEKKEKRKLHSN